LLLMIDLRNLSHLRHISDELFGAGLRLNQKKPDVVVTKKGQGGICVNSTVKLTCLNENVVRSIASEFVINADIIIREDIDEDQLIDVFSQNRVYVSAFVVINKIDSVDKDALFDVEKKLKDEGWVVVCISAEKGIGLDLLMDTIFSELKLIRVYMKPVGKKTDFNQPLILREGNTVEDACRKLHRDFKRKFRYANVSGPSAKHDVQKVGLDHILADKDVLTIVIWR